VSTVAGLRYWSGRLELTIEGTTYATVWGELVDAEGGPWQQPARGVFFLAPRRVWDESDVDRAVAFLRAFGVTSVQLLGKGELGRKVVDEICSRLTPPPAALPGGTGTDRVKALSVGLGNYRHARVIGAIRRLEAAGAPRISTNRLATFAHMNATRDLKPALSELERAGHVHNHGSAKEPDWRTYPASK
jgi:hypothetical protein